ncbi:MAG: hypothetical protein K2X81_18740 [Candidatus Obscuribacterales bacterium]|nr:hypothetical protein [Candidatus Obscuribacterales bacterium]
MKPQITKLSAWLALCSVSGLMLCPTFVRADVLAAGNATPVRNTSATVMPVSYATVDKLGGEVSRAETVSSASEELGAFSKCSAGDVLPEGTVVKTGRSSWTSLKWNNIVTTRLWENTVARIYPTTRTVCLGKGDLVLKKDKHSFDTYIVETKRLQARIHGTTVKVVTDDILNRDTVLVTECQGAPVEVFNKINGSRIVLTPGIVLEVSGKIVGNDPRFRILSSESQSIKSIASNPEYDLRLNPKRGELIFQDKNSTTIAYTANAKAVLADPMNTGTSIIPPIESLDLIKAAMKKVPSSDSLLGNIFDAATNGNQPDKLIRNIKIAKAPQNTFYAGPNVGYAKSITLPESTDSFLAGELPNPNRPMNVISHNSVGQQPAKTAVPTFVVPFTSGPDSPNTDDVLESALKSINSEKNTETQSLDITKEEEARVSPIDNISSNTSHNTAENTGRN